MMEIHKLGRIKRIRKRKLTLGRIRGYNEKLNKDGNEGSIGETINEDGLNL